MFIVFSNSFHNDFVWIVELDVERFWHFLSLSLKSRARRVKYSKFVTLNDAKRCGSLAETSGRKAITFHFIYKVVVFFLDWSEFNNDLQNFFYFQEEYIKDEQRNLKKEYLHAQEEVKRIQSVPLVIGESENSFKTI